MLIIIALRHVDHHVASIILSSYRIYIVFMGSSACSMFASTKFVGHQMACRACARTSARLGLRMRPDSG